MRSGEVVCSIQRVKEDRYPLAGSLEVISFELVVQAIGAAWRSGVLLVDCDGTVAKVYFEEGRIVCARLGAMEGQEAFNRIYSRTRGWFLFQPGHAAPRKDMDGTVLHHLLAAARAKDESSEATAQLYVVRL